MAGEYSFTYFMQDVTRCSFKSQNTFQALNDLEKSYRKNDTEKASRCAKTAVVSLLSDGLPEVAAKFLLGLCQQSAGQKDADVGIKEEQEMGGKRKTEDSSQQGTKPSSEIGNRGNQNPSADKSQTCNVPSTSKDLQIKRKGHPPLNASLPLPQQTVDTREADYFLGLLHQLEIYTDQAPGPSWPEESASVKQSEKFKHGWDYAVRIKTKMGKALEEHKKITNGFEGSLNKIISENNTLMTQIADLKRQLTDLTQTNGAQEQLVNKFFHTNEKLEKKTMDLKAENEAMLKHIKKSEKKMAEVETQLSDRLRDKDRELQDAKRELDTLKTRFSKIAGDRMTGGNSNITDLSDPDRQMKLGEKYGNTYDDEWTDAFVIMQESFGYPQKEAIDFLLFVLKDSFEHCKKVSSEQFTALRTLLLYPDESCVAQGGDMEMRLQSKDQNDLLALRRQISAKSDKVITQKFVSDMKKKLTDGKENPDIVDKCLPYVKKCVEICWQLVLHNPPMHIAFDLDHRAKFDTLLFNRYGQTGDKYDSLVWPPLFVSVNGGLVSKGTAQPIPGGKNLAKKK